MTPPGRLLATMLTALLLRKPIPASPRMALQRLAMATVLTLIGNFLADVAYVWLDPRVSFREVER